MPAAVAAARNGIQPAFDAVVRVTAQYADAERNGPDAIRYVV